MKEMDKDLPHLTFDYEGLLERVEHDRELLRDLLTIFKQGFPRQLLALREAVEARDGDRVATAAHTLGGMLSNRGASQAAATAARLEQMGRDYLTKPFDPEELEARLRTGLRILGLENRLVEAREEMRFKASHDALTTLWNRAVILELLERELSRSHRENATTVIILCDIDHFKDVNDTFGHLIGDELLRETSKRLLAAVRSYDFVGRYGGEEFLIVLNNCDPAFAAARAEEIRNTIAQRPVQTSTGPVPVTMSLGLLLSHQWGTRSVEELLREADIALYAAKAAGRNCVKLASPTAALGVSDSRLNEPARQR